MISTAQYAKHTLFQVYSSLCAPYMMQRPTLEGLRMTEQCDALQRHQQQWLLLALGLRQEYLKCMTGKIGEGHSIHDAASSQTSPATGWVLYFLASFAIGEVNSSPMNDQSGSGLIPTYSTCALTRERDGKLGWNQIRCICQESLMGSSVEARHTKFKLYFH